MSSQAGISLWPGGQLGIGGDDAQLLLAGEGPLALFVPAVVERALVLLDPLHRRVVRGMRGARSPVDKERLIGVDRLLRLDPIDRLVGHVLGEVIRGVTRHLHPREPVEDLGEPLIGLPADEAVELLEALHRRPVLERSQRARLPHRHLVALAELGGGVAVVAQRLGQGRLRVWDHRGVAWRG